MLNGYPPEYATDNRHINCCFVVATEEIIFPSQSNWTYDIFSQIVIPKQASVLQACHHDDSAESVPS